MLESPREDAARAHSVTVGPQAPPQAMGVARANIQLLHIEPLPKGHTILI